jgi:hypothetical protein
MRTILIPAVAVLLLLAACKKEDEKEKEQAGCEQYASSKMAIDTATRQFVFKQGSYWVYEDPYTLNRDSVYISNYEGGYDCTDSMAAEYAYMELKSTFYGSTVTLVVRGDFPGLLLLRDRGALNPIFWIYKKDSIRDRACSAYMESFPVLTLPHGNFPATDVFLIENSNGICETDVQNRCALYFSPGYGIVKKYVYTDEGSDAWEIVKWKIKQ